MKKVEHEIWKKAKITIKFFNYAIHAQTHQEGKNTTIA